VDYVRRWTQRAELPAARLLGWLELGTSKFHQWKQHYGTPHAHNGHVPRDGWLEPWEKQAILDFHDRHPLEGYRCLTYMMLDDDVVAVSPSSVYRVLKTAGRLDRKWQKPSRKGHGFVQPTRPHEHWHVDISYLNLGGTFYYLCSILDGYSRFIVHWEIREAMKEQDTETIIQRALEKFPGGAPGTPGRPRIISDNGPQFIAKDFKQFIRVCGLTHVRTSPYYPQSNGKLERWHGTLKGERFRQASPGTLEEARRVVTAFVAHYNQVRLHSALGYITPEAKLAGLETAIFAERDRKLETARRLRLGTPHLGTQRKASGVQGAAMSPLVADTMSAKSCQDGCPVKRLVWPSAPPSVAGPRGPKSANGESGSYGSPRTPPWVPVGRRRPRGSGPNAGDGRCIARGIRSGSGGSPEDAGTVANRPPPT
jgi:transposase InsO family protein